jgi:excisionase family DNA binding protein
VLPDDPLNQITGPEAFSGGQAPLKAELFPSLETRRLFTVAEAARLLVISVPGVHVWIRKGKIRRLTRVSKRGGYRIPRAEIIRILRSAGREVPGLWTLRRTKVLLIDDDGPIRELVQAAFRTPAYAAQVETAATPEDGLLLVAQFRPDVILLDSFHPKTGISSDQALAIIRRAKILRGVRIISLCPGKGAAPKTSAPRPDAFLPKPFSTGELREAVLGLPLGAVDRAARPAEATQDRRRWEYKVSRRSRSPADLAH